MTNYKRHLTDVIEIDNQNVTYYKGRVIGYDKTVITRSSFANVRKNFSATF